MSFVFRSISVVFALCVVCPAAPASAQTGPVAAYGFNEGTGTTTPDASGNGHTGTITGASWNASGRFGGALSFNGTSNWVTVADTALLDLTSAMTIEAWVYPSTNSGWRSVILKESSTGLSYGLYNSDGSGRPSGWIRRASDIGATGSSALPTNTWTHLAVTYNGSAVVLYVNGVQVATGSTTGAIVTSSNPLRIGGNAPWGEYFAGRIDDVRVYNRALTAAQIQTDMATPVGGAAPAADFTLGATPTSQTLTQGNSTTYTVNIAAVNGFSGVVNLSVSGQPATATFSPTTLTGSGSSTLTVTTTGSTSTGSRTLTITGTSGALTRTATVALVVNAVAVADFTIAATPSARTITQGAGTTYTATIGAVNGFTGVVTLSASGLPANTTASFAPASVTGSGGSTLTLTTAANTPAATSTITITGTSGTLTRTATVTLVVNTAPVPDFTIAASPSSRTSAQGSSTTYTVTIGAVNGFTGVVALSASGLPANASASFSPASVTASGSSTLTVTTAANTPAATSTITITGTSGALTHTAPAALVVTAAPVADFTIASAPGSQTVAPGSSTTYTVTIGAVNGFTGAVTLAAAGLPANTSAAFSPASVTGSGTSTMTVTTAASTPAGSSTVTVTGTSGSLVHSATSTLVVGAAASGIPISIDFVGTAAAMAATESAGVVPATNWNSATGATSTTPLALRNSAGAATGATATWASNNTWSTSIANQAGNLRMMKGYLDTSTTSVTSVTVAGLPSAAYDVTVYADGDNGSDTRTGAYAISGPGLTPATINLTDAANTNFSAAFTQANGSSGNYVRFSIVGSGFTVTATPGTAGGSRRAPLNGLQIVPTAPPTPDFTVAATPGTRSLTQGSSTSYTVTIGAVNGFAGAVNFAVAGLPANATSSFTPGSVNGGGTATLNVTTAANTPAGTSTLTVTGTSGAVTRTTTVSLAVTAAPVPDFTVSATPATRAISQGISTTYTVTIGAVNGFTGAVSLAASGLPANATASFSPASVTGAGTSTLTIATAAATPAGTFTLTLTGTSGALTHAATVTLTVNGPTFSLAGVITPAASGASATVTLGGTAAASTTVNGSGGYSFAGLADGSYLVTPSKSGFTFSPANRSVTVAGANVTSVDFTASQSPNTIAISSPSNGATVAAAFSISATASASIVAVQFRVDGGNAGPEDTSAPFSVSVTAPGGAHTLTAVGRDASGATVTSSTVNVTVNSGSGTALTINGAQTFQTIDGFGVNLNSLSWKNGELQPALDLIVDGLGAQTYRVVFDMADWEDPNDNADPAVADWSYYNALYSNAKFQNLWGTLRYLNQKGITSGIMLSFMGRVPPWMGGPRITASLEDEWVEMISTVLQYARDTENLQFDLVDPINEPDWDGFEGPQVDQWQYTRLLQKLSEKLDLIGLGSLRFVGPNTAAIGSGVDTYIPEMMTNAVVMSKLDHFGLHNYAGLTGGADARIKGSAYPLKNFWMTELSIPEQIFTMIGQGASGAQIWDAYDSVYHHAILAGAFYNDGRGSTPPNDAGNLAALMSYNSTAGTYARRQQFYQMQAFKYVTGGSVRVGATESNSSLAVYAFRHPTTGRVTIVGRNIGGSSITLNGSLSNVGSVGLFQFYQTGISDNYNSFPRGSDVVVTNGSFVVTVPSNSYFTLTTPVQ